MICIIAGNYNEAKRYAAGQQWEDEEWFYPADEYDLSGRKNFHVIVIGTAGQNVPQSYFDRVFELAKNRGRMK